ncbi:MAG: Co2+/Mg2+ efflux protein ApaG [Rickettsiales bacterium]|nr:MAG: Co2+/Mg2+ efflux protein ApaG [Rickettsiales bacterium]
MYSEISNSLKVTVIPSFMDELSSSADHTYIWSYNIVLENLSDITVQLISRYWQIIDEIGQVQEVRGEGVVGQQPLLNPGEAFEYTSHTQLTTESGIMLGKYIMIKKSNGEEFTINIPAFSLDISDKKNLIN